MRSNQYLGKRRKPSWIKTDLPYGEKLNHVKNLNRRLNLHTVCEEAACPNLGECWDKKHATYMILGKECTRRCKFCNIQSKSPKSVTSEEPYNVAEAVKALDLSYVIITSVTRDDLKDCGLKHYLKTLREIRKIKKDISIELLIPDFNCEKELIKEIANSEVEVIGHNIEMVPRLYPDIRPNSNYRESLQVLRWIKDSDSNVITKSALIVGLGESKEEIQRTIGDIANSGIEILHIGQYLRPSSDHVEVKRYYTNEEFKKLKVKALHAGIKVVKSGPMIRSSYKARDSYKEVKEKNV